MSNSIVYRTGEYVSPIYKTNTTLSSLIFDSKLSLKNDSEAKNMQIKIKITLLLKNGQNSSKEILRTIEDGIGSWKTELDADDFGISKNMMESTTHFRYQITMFSGCDNSFVISDINIVCKGVDKTKDLVTGRYYINNIPSTFIHNNMEYKLSQLKSISYVGTEDTFNHIDIQGKKSSSLQWSRPYRKQNGDFFYRMVCADGETKSDIEFNINPNNFVYNKEKESDLRDSEKIDYLNEYASKRLLFNVFIPTVGEDGAPIDSYVDLNNGFTNIPLNKIRYLSSWSEWQTINDIDSLYERYTKYNNINYSGYNGGYIVVTVKDAQNDASLASYYLIESGLYDIPLGDYSKKIKLNISIVRKDASYTSPSIDQIIMEANHIYSETKSVGPGKEISCEINAFTEFEGNKPVFYNNNVKNFFDIEHVGFNLPFWYDFNGITSVSLNPFKINIDPSFVANHPDIYVYINYNINKGNLIYYGDKAEKEKGTLYLKGSDQLTEYVDELVMGTEIGVISPYVAVNNNLPIKYTLFYGKTNIANNDPDLFEKSKIVIGEQDNFIYKQIYKVCFTEETKKSDISFNLYYIDRLNQSINYISSQSLNDEFYLTDSLNEPVSIGIDGDTDIDLNNWITVTKGFVGTINAGNIKSDYYRVFERKDLPAYSLSDEELNINDLYTSLSVWAANQEISMSISTNEYDDFIVETQNVDLYELEVAPGIFYQEIDSYELKRNGQIYGPIFISFEEINNFDTGLQNPVTKDSVFSLSPSDSNISLSYIVVDKGIEISGEETFDLRTNWIPKIKGGYYNLGSTSYIYNPKTYDFQYTDIADPIIEGVSIVPGNNGTMGEIKNKENVVFDNLLEQENTTIFYEYEKY